MTIIPSAADELKEPRFRWEANPTLSTPLLLFGPLESPFILLNNSA